MTDTILRINDVTKATGLSRSTIYLMISRGEFEPPVKLSDRAVGWKSTAIEAFINSRVSTKAVA